MRVLVVEDDLRWGPELCRGLRERGATVHGPLLVPQGIAAVADATFDGALVDLRVAGLDGLDVVDALATHQPRCQVVVLTGFGSIDSAVRALRRGAHDYVSKPASDDEIWRALQGTRHVDAASVPTLDRVEHEHIERVLGYTEGNISRAASLLGMHRRSLQRKLNKKP